MRQVEVYYKEELAGYLTEHSTEDYTYQYTREWIENDSKSAISLTLPKTLEVYTSKYLFAFFHNMLPEGTNRKVICLHNKIDPHDYFSLLIKTAAYDTIGAVTVKQIR